jgi:hypothetical protein
MTGLARHHLVFGGDEVLTWQDVNLITSSLLTGITG